MFGSQMLDDLIDLGDARAQLQMPRTGRTAARISLCADFVSRPQVQKNNRNSIFVFVNGRLIRDRLLLHALLGAITI